jgi:photosystem II stability/assembly factor-like uncharacterized protein
LGAAATILAFASALIVHETAKQKAFAAPAQESVTALPARAHWCVDSGGHLQRSFGQGAWQTVLAGEPLRFHVVALVGSDVWAGGENLMLYHSSDDGDHWMPVALPPKSSSSQTIVRIHFDDAQSGRIEAEGGTVWSTADGGLTWK